uniref:Zinc finger protein 385A-like n=1 Tax=Oncorhynchus kisutch TaxID=8019 RepID=A0A8C7N076_ONCKI
MPAFLRTPTMIQPHLDMKPFLQFPMDTAPPQHSMGLFHNFNTSQADAHYKGNRHARRVKGIETSKSRPQEGDKSGRPVSLTSSPSLPGEPPTSTPDISDPCNPDEPRLSLPPPLMAPPGPLPPLPPLSTHDSPLAPSVYPMLTTPTLTPSPLLPSSSDSPVGFNTTIPEQSGVPVAPVAPGAPAGPETEEDKVKKLLYCSLCKVSVNSLSQLEAHNKGTKHKTILEARSGLGPIKAYPRLGPKPPGELGGGPLDPNTEERTFHCEICNVRVNSELQLKQHISSRRHRDGVAGKPNPLLSRHKKHRIADLTSSLNFSKDLSKCLGAGLLPSPLAVAAAMAAAASSNHQLAQLRAAAASSAQHHPHHHHHHLLQGPPLSHAILRPAPGPMRTSHVPILFSPY